jgi:hypothetical protein
MVAISSVAVANTQNASPQQLMNVVRSRLVACDAAKSLRSTRCFSNVSTRFITSPTSTHNTSTVTSNRSNFDAPRRTTSLNTFQSKRFYGIEEFFDQSKDELGRTKEIGIVCLFVSMI